MAAGPEDSKFTVRTLFKFSWILVVIVFFIVAGIFYSRWRENRDIEERAAAAKRAQARQLVENFGGNDFKILSFYAAPGAIHSGDTAELCYGVSNAQSVHLEPKASEDVWPAFSRCVQVSPRKTTTYTLTALDSSRRNISATVTIEVH